MSDKLDGKSADVEQLNIEKLKSVFPECVNLEPNGKFHVDTDKLLSLLGNYIDDEFEKYSFTWKGKSECLKIAQKRSSATLLPCKEESVDFENTQNLYIEGDNLEVLKLLQKSYFGKVKMIFIDPPYNTGNDFVYKDNYKDPLGEYKRATSQENKSNAETLGRFHTNWLNMIYPRIRLAVNLLRDDGSIFITIDDNEFANLKKVCDEIFGEENFVGNFIWESRTSISNDSEISNNHNYCLVYSKNKDKLQFWGDDIDQSDYVNPDNDPRGPWKLVPIDANHVGGDTVYPIKNPKTGVEYLPPNGRIWSYNKETMKQLMEDGRIKFGLNDDSAPKRKLYYYERIKKGDKKTPSSILKNIGTLLIAIPFK